MEPCRQGRSLLIVAEQEKMSRLMTKPTKLHERSAKTQISRLGWSEKDAQTDLSLRWAHRSLVLSGGGS